VVTYNALAMFDVMATDDLDGVRVEDMRGVGWAVRRGARVEE
jgi:hypothetical protein